MERINCLIIGGGPAGYTAAIYASRAALAPVLYEGNVPGGQLTTTTVVENFPGYPKGVDANQLMADMREQAVNLGADIRRGVVTKADLGVRPFRLTVDGTTELEADALIIATGATARYLGLPSEEKFRGLGVSACATCDGFFYRKKDVAVVGGGDTACEEATYLAGLCRKVYMIVRRDVLRASVAMQERVKNTPNIEILWWSARMARFLIYRWTASSWPSAITPSPSFSRPGCRPMPTDTSSRTAAAAAPTWRVCSRPETCRIRCTARR